jgi:NAD-dependent dihydropyrimidine dehydrogenase PreA subunit
MKRLGLIAAAAAAVFLFALHQDVGGAQAANSSNTADTYKQLNLFGDVFELVRSDYVDEVSDETLVEGAINGMLTALDPHSNYLNAKNFNDMKVQTRGEFGGLGIEVSMENGLVKVVSPIDDTPAAHAGLKPGDLITNLDGTPVQGLTLPEAVEKMRGPVNSDINLTIRREEGRGHLAQRVLRPIRGRAHRAAGHGSHRHDEARWNVGRCRRSRGVDAERRANCHAARTHVSAQVALRRGAAHRGRRMSRQPHLAVAVHADRRSGETSHRDTGLVQRGHTRQHRGSKRGGCGRRERAARKDGRERRAFVGIDRDPDAVGVRAPRKHGREGRVAVFGEPLNSRNRRCCLSRGHRDLVDHGGLSVLEHSLPTLARPGGHEFNQLRLRFALGHHRCMVPFKPMAYVIVQPCIGVKDASCVEVCPVDCIHTDDAAQMYYIDPDECIDCGACVDPCPVDAIFPEDEVPDQWRDFIKINADYFKNR